MDKIEIIRKHEEGQADIIARRLIERPRLGLHWKTILIPFQIIDYIRYRKTIFVTRKNVLFTRQLALDGAQEISKGEDRNSVIDKIDTKTKEILNKEACSIYIKRSLGLWHSIWSCVS